MSENLSENLSTSLKVLWLEPKVQFQGKGIITVWREALQKRGWDVTEDVREVDSCDVIFFGSDSQLRPSLIGKKPTICFFWGWEPKRFTTDPDGKFREGVWEKVTLLRSCTRILVPSPGTRDQLMMIAGFDGEMVPVGIDTEFIDSVPQPEDGKDLQVMFCSRLAPHKRLDIVIKAMSFLDPAPKLLVVGPGDPTPYQQLANQLGVSNIEFCELSDEDKIAQMKHSLFFVHASEYEGWGLPPMEAIYAGTATLLSDTPHNRWVFKEFAGYFGSAEELAILIMQLVNDELNDIRQRTFLGRKAIGEHGNLDAVCTSLWAHFHQTIKEFLAGQLREHPDKWAEIYDAEHRRNWAYGGPTSPEGAGGPARFDPTWARHWRAQMFLSKLNECGAKKIIDIGCGAVYPTIFAREGYEITAVDISEEALRQVDEIAKKWGVSDKVDVCQGDAHKLESWWHGGCFDAAILGEILEHVDDPQNIVAEALRVVRSGGYVIATTPIGTHHYDPMHMNIFTDEGITQLAESFEIEGRAQLVELSQVAEDGCDPSCFLMVLQKT